LGLQRVLGLGSYQTAWAWLHKRRRAMVRPGRDRLDGEVEVDEYTFRYNRRRSRAHGMLFYRLLEQATQVDPAPYPRLVGGKTHPDPNR